MAGHIGLQAAAALGPGGVSGGGLHILDRAWRRAVRAGRQSSRWP